MTPFHEYLLVAIETGITKATELSAPSSLAIVDEGAHLVAFWRMPRAKIGTIEIAQGKAYTASAFQVTTRSLGAMSEPGAACFGLHASGASRPFIVFGGGIPIFRDERHLGGIGVSGGSPDVDEAIATAMAAVLSGQ